MSGEALRSRSIRVAAAVVWAGDRVLMTQRPPGGPRELQWEFPGGKIETGETPEAALVRELREELGVAATVLGLLHRHTHRYGDGLEVELHFAQCTLDSYEFTTSPAVHRWRWVRPAEVDLSEVLEADREFLRGLTPAR